MRSSPRSFFLESPGAKPPAARRSRLKAAARPALGLLAPGLAGWGGYGLGVAAAADLSTGRTLAAAGLLAAGAACALPGLRRGAAKTQSDGPAAGRSAADAAVPGSFAGDAATLESLAPAAAAHPDGLACLRTLADLLFQARHAAPAASPAAPAGETAVREGGAR